MSGILNDFQLQLNSITVVDATSSDTVKNVGIIENPNPINLEFLDDHVPIGDMQLLCNTTQRTFTEIKGKQDYSNNATLLDLNENDVIIHGHNISVTTSKETLNQWQVEDGLMITKFVKRVSLLSLKVDDEQFNPKSHTYQPLPDEDVLICEELQNTEDFAVVLIADTIKEAKERRNWILNSEDYVKSSTSSSSTKPSQWPSIKSFTKDLGITCIENYILNYGEFTENWKYTIISKSNKKDKMSDLYLYEVTISGTPLKSYIAGDLQAQFSLPNRLYPIPQVTAIVFFMMEVSRVIPNDCPVKVWLRLETSRRDLDPSKYFLKEKDLLAILDLKLYNFKKFTF